MRASTNKATKSNGLSPLVSMVQGAFGKERHDFQAQGILAAIARGKWRKEIAAIRQTHTDTLAQTGSVEDAKKAVRKLKEKLFGVQWSGTFSARGDKNLKAYAGLLCADLDDLSPDDLPALRDKLARDPHAHAVFVSPTGTGLKVVFRVAGDGAHHYNNFLAVRKHVKDTYGLDVDEACKNPERLCFVSDDPAAEWYSEAEPLEPLAEPEAKARPEKAKAKARDEGKPARPPVTENRLRELLAVIPADDRQVWFTALAAVKLWGEDIGDTDLAYDIANEWSQSSPKYDAETQRQTWESLKRETGDNVATIGSLFKLAKEHGWQGQRSTLPFDGPPPGEENPEERRERLIKLASKYKDYSLWECSQAAIDPADTLLGKRWLCRGGGALFIGSTGLGKSSALVNMGLFWSLGREAFGVLPARPLRILIVQAENDSGDLTEMSRPLVTALDLSADDIENVHQRTTVVSINDQAGFDLVFLLEGLILRYRPDLTLLDPLNSYLGSDPSDAEAVTAFCRRGLNPVLTRTRSGLILCHHTPKTRAWDTTRWKIQDWSQAGAGASDLANWARATLVLDATHAPGVFKLIASKRGERLGWTDDFDEPTAFRYFSHAKGEILWHPATPEQIHRAEQADQEKRGGAPQKYSDSQILRPLGATDNGLTLAEHWQALQTAQCPIAKSTLKERLASLAVRGQVETVEGRFFLAFGNQLPNAEHSERNNNEAEHSK